MHPPVGSSPNRVGFDAMITPAATTSAATSPRITKFRVRLAKPPLLARRENEQQPAVPQPEK